MKLRFIALAVVVIAASLSICAVTADAETWRGLTVAPEHRCAPYNKKRDYPYSQSVEQKIVKQLGMIYGPYTGRCFVSTHETDIEHMVAASEAHDSGLCARDQATRKRFASDLLNLTLASPGVNRHQKSGKDAAEWLPEKNQCWFVTRIVEVRQKYNLTIDQREAAALEQVLSNCESTEMVKPVACSPCIEASQPAAPVSGDGADPLALYDDNGNGRITCKEARRHGIAPVNKDHPAYRFMRDGDGNGVVCE